MIVSDEAMRWAGALLLWSICAFGVWINWDKSCRWWHPFAAAALMLVVGALLCGVTWLIGAALTWAGVVA